jgi:hypothetical protein
MENTEEFNVIAFSTANKKKKQRMLDKLPILDLENYRQEKNETRR